MQVNFVSHLYVSFELRSGESLLTHREFDKPRSADRRHCGKHTRCSRQPDDRRACTRQEDQREGSIPRRAPDVHKEPEEILRRGFGPYRDMSGELALLRRHGNGFGTRGKKDEDIFPRRDH